MKVRHVVASLGVASVALMVAVGSVRAADEWFVLSEQTIKAANPRWRSRARWSMGEGHQEDQVLRRGR